MIRITALLCICLLTSVLLIIILFLPSENSFPFSTFLPYSSSSNTSSSNHSSIIDTVDLNIHTNQTFKCVKTKLLLNKYQTTVCVYEQKQDTDVSGSLISAGIWEEYLVTRIIRILSTYPEYGFIDIGANLGIYTMYATTVGCSNVVSIECFRPNIDRIRHAIQLEHVQKQVILIPLALYNKSNVYLSLRANIQNNVGSQRITNEVRSNNVDQDPMIVKTMRFDDLLPIINQRKMTQAIIKIDIETSEHFLCATGEMMFNVVNIPFVMMEWANIKTISTKANVIRNFFTRRHYIPYNPETCQVQNETDHKLWKSQDIYWIKQNYHYLCQL